jgi:hypothetical protein
VGAADSTVRELRLHRRGRSAVRAPVLSCLGRLSRAPGVA